MNPSPKVSAAAAKEAYADHLSSDIDNNAKQIFFGHQRYVVFGYTADSATGLTAESGGRTGRSSVKRAPRPTPSL